MPQAHYTPHGDRSRHDSRDRRGEKEVTVKAFYVAILLFAANVATFLKVDRAAFLAHAAHAFDRISRENARRKPVSVDPDESRESGPAGPRARW